MINKKVILMLIMLVVGCSKHTEESKIIYDKTIITAEDAKFSIVNSFCLDSNRNLYIIDPLEFSIIKINSVLKNIIKAGKRGSGPGEFISPTKIDVKSNSLAVLDRMNRSISVFDTNLVFVDKITSKFGAPYSFLFGNKNNIYMLNNTGRSVIISNEDLITKSSNSIFEFKTKNKNPLYNMFHCALDSRGYFIIAFYFKNEINIYDTNMKFVKKIALDFLPKQPKEKNGIPLYPLIFGLGIDLQSDRMYILTGENEKSANFGISAINENGKQVGFIKLSDEASLIKVYGNNIFITQKGNTIIAKYNFTE